MSAYDSRILQSLMANGPITTVPSDRKPHDPLTSDLPVRPARASPPDDKMSDFVSHIHLVSRIANGIVLQNGLIESSIPVTDFLADILCTGPMTFEELSAMNKDLVDDLMGMMKKASAELEKNAEAVIIDNHYNNMNSIIMSEVPPGAFEKFAGKQEYGKFLVDLNSSLANGNTVNDQQTKDLTTLLGRMSNFTSEQGNVKQIEVFDLQKVPYMINETKTEIESYHQNFLPIVKKLKELKEKSSFVKLLIEEEKMRKWREDIKDMNITAEAQAADNYKLFDELGSHLAKNPENIQKFFGLASALKSNRHPDRKYTAGFPNGVYDLNKILQDVTDKWFLKSSSIDEETTRVLREIFLPLDSLSMILKKVVDAWEPAIAKADVAEAVLSLQLRIGSNSGNAAARTTAVKAMKDCHLKHPILKMRSTYNTKDVLKPIIDLNNEVDKLGETSTTVFFKNFDVLENVAKFTNDDKPTIQKETPEMVKRLKGMPERAEIKKQLEKFLNESELLKTLVKNFAQKVGSIESKLNEIEEHQKAVIDVHFDKWFGCMKAVEDNAAPVAEMIGTIQKLREVGVQGVADTETFLTTIQTSASPLHSAKDTAENMTVLKELAKLLKLPEDSNEGVKALSRASERLAQIAEVAQNRHKLKPLMEDMSFMTEAANGVEKDLTSEDQASLKELASLPKSLTEMFAGIDALISIIQSFAGKDINSCKEILEAAQKVIGVKTEAGKWKTAVEALARKVPTIQKQLDVVSDALDQLVDQLELDFASLKTDDVMTMLDRLVNFFDELQKTIASRPGGRLHQLESSAGALSAIQIIVISTIVVIVVLIISAIIFVFWFRKRYQKLSSEEITALNNEDIRAVFPSLSRMLTVVDALLTAVWNAVRDNGECVQIILARTFNEPINRNFVGNVPMEVKRDPTYQVIAENVVIVTLSDGTQKYLNVNKVTMNDPPQRGRVYLIGQTPVGNCEATFAMIEQNGVSLCVLLNSPHDRGLDRCPNFFPKSRGPATRIGAYEVKFKKRVPVPFVHDARSYEMYMVKYRRGREAWKIVRFLIFNKMDFDRNHPTPSAAVELIEYMRLFPVGRSIAVLCPSGVDRAATLVGIRFFMNRAEQDRRDYAAWVQEFRSIRHNALNRPITLWFAFTAMVKGLLERFSAEEFHAIYPKMLFTYEKFVREEYARNGVNLPWWEAEMDARGVFVNEKREIWRQRHPDWAQNQDEAEQRREERDELFRIDVDEALERMREGQPRINPLIPLAEQQNRNRQPQRRPAIVPGRPRAPPGRARPRTPPPNARYEPPRR